MISMTHAQADGDTLLDIVKTETHHLVAALTATTLQEAETGTQVANLHADKAVDQTHVRIEEKVEEALQAPAQMEVTVIVNDMQIQESESSQSSG